MIKNKVLWGSIVAIIIIVLIWVKVDWQLKQNNSGKATESTSLTPSESLNDEVDTAEQTGNTSKNTSTEAPAKTTVTTNPLVTILSNSQKLAEISYKIVPKDISYNTGIRTMTLNGYGYSFIEHSSSTKSVTLAKIKANFANMTLDILNSGAASTGITAYVDSKYVCVSFEKPTGVDIRGDKEVTVKCAYRPTSR